MNTKQFSPVGRFDIVLLATDCSEYSAGAERVAVELCAHQSAHLHVLSAVAASGVTGWLGPQADNDAAEALNENHALIAQQAEQAGVTCTAHVEAGDDPYEVIVANSRSLTADVIIMGRRGRRGLARLMLGDATAKVIGYAPCAVLVVPEEAEMWSSALLATDGSRFSDAAAVTVAALVKKDKIPVTVLSVAVPFHSEARQAEAGPIVERVVDYLKEQGVEAEGIVAEGNADEAILEVAERRKAGLIVLGSFGRTGFNRILFGSKAERVINYTTGSVMVVRGG